MQISNSLFKAVYQAARRESFQRIIAEDIQGGVSSYQDIIDDAFAYASILKSHLKRGENFGILMPNCVETIALILGANASQRTPAMLNYSAGIQSIKQACEVALIQTIVTSKDFIQKLGLQSVIETLESIRIIYIEDEKNSQSFRSSFLKKIFNTIQFVNLHRVNLDDPAVILFTSGSEARPKAVIHSNASILANIRQIQARLTFTQDDRIFICLPMFHSFGFTCGALMPLILGCQLLLYPTPLHFKEIPMLLKNKNATVFFSTSTFLSQYIKFLDQPLPLLRYIIAGAEKLSQAVYDVWLSKLGHTIYQGYGVTECAPAIAVNNLVHHRVGTVGQLLEGMMARIQPVEGIEEGGILEVKGPNVMKGYYLPDAPGILRTLLDGWYSTGDVAIIDEDGFIKITGRVKRFAKVAGEMVSLDITEQIAKGFSSDYLYGAIALPNHQTGESIILFTNHPTLKKTDLVHIAKAQGYSSYHLPSEIIRMDNLPLLASGKIHYEALKTWEKPA
jgi:acyl-[acyl-carrier-protein]-phospholipid O-acyltransferase / long-chain-fatty-acid--[acyl-carrier-protein] ligase